MAEVFEKLPTDGIEVKLKLLSVITVHPVPDISAASGDSYTEDLKDEEFYPAEDFGEDGDEPQRLEVTTTAAFAEENGRVTVTYDDSEILDLPETLTQITFKRNEPGVINIVRSGGLSSMLVIEEGKHHASEYKLGPYSLPVSVYGRRVRNTVGDGEGEIELDYVIEMSGADTQRSRMKITLSK